MANYSESDTIIPEGVGKWLIVGLFGFFLMIILLGSFYIISAGERGVLLTFGEADTVVKEEGLHFKIPIIQQVVKMEVRTQKYETIASAASKDLQVVSTTVATNFHIIPEAVPDLFVNLGLSYMDRVIAPMEQEVVKSVTARYTAEELITKRELVRQEIKNILTERLAERSIIVEEVSITNFDFSDVFNKAIEEKVTAEQLQLKAKWDLERIKVEAEQKVTQAKAEADAITLQSEALRQSQDVLQLRAIEKWTGQLPSVMCSDAMPFIDVSTFSGANA